MRWSGAAVSTSYPFNSLMGIEMPGLMLRDIELNLDTSFGERSFSMLKNCSGSRTERPRSFQSSLPGHSPQVEKALR